MDKRDITFTIAKYVVNNAETLKGKLSRANYFNFGGSTLDSEVSKVRLYRGYAVDILAEAIEKRNFFGSWIPDSPDQACNCNNAKLTPFNKLGCNLVLDGLDFQETEEGLLIKVPLTPAKSYTIGLKNPDNFKRYSEIADLRSGFGKHQKTEAEIIKSIDMLFASG